MINFEAVLANRDKRTLLVYARQERASQALRAFVDLAKIRKVKFTAFMSSCVVKFPEGGHATFRHAESELQGIELDKYMVEDAVEKRLGNAPLLTLLATRPR